MKALKSPLAKEILADPLAKNQLRVYLAHKSAQTALSGGVERASIELPSQRGTHRYVPTVVPKAA
jgi:hypothetical protein